jgi:ketosteroid isomerase-like protein
VATTDPTTGKRIDLPPRFKGGSAEDQQRILSQYHEFLAANDALDNDHLRRLWVDDPNDVFFNLNGFTYYGREDWLKVWDHYRTRFSQTGSYSTGDLVIWINGDFALLTADQGGRYKDWVGQEPGDSPKHYRASVMFVRQPGDTWQIFHAHFSTSSPEGMVRPDKMVTPESPLHTAAPHVQADYPFVAERTEEHWRHKQADGRMATEPISDPEVAKAQHGLFVDGGTEHEQKAVLRHHHEFLTANDGNDPVYIRKIWSDDPDAVFFNTNGFTYHGRDDWEKIWNFYGPRQNRFAIYTPGNVRIWISGDMALTTGDYGGLNKQWLSGPDMRMNNTRHYRLTTAQIRQAGEWQTIHAHFSIQALGPRPEQQA